MITAVQGNTPFGNLIVTEKLTGRLAEKGEHSDFSKRFNEVKSYIQQNKLDKKRYVDVILDSSVNDGDKFVAEISSKKYGTPSGPDSVVTVKNSALGELKKWINNWNHDYSPKMLKKWGF